MTLSSAVLRESNFVTLRQPGHVVISQGCGGMQAAEGKRVVARILIVDDDRSIRRTLEKFLGGEGYEVVTAQDAPGAITTATEQTFDLMLLDLGLPGGS